MELKSEYVLSWYVDKRRIKNGNVYPIKLKLYIPKSKPVKRYYYPTKYNFNEKEFQLIMDNNKTVKGNNKKIRNELHSFLVNAEEIAESIKPFDIKKFEKKLSLKPGEGENVFYHYNEKIKRNKELGSFGNANNYELSKKSIQSFLEYKTGLKVTKLKFKEISERWLEDYEKYMYLKILSEDKETVIKKPKSTTTVSMYLRALRSVFNEAINEGDISSDIYPYGKNKYRIPAAKKVKKALNDNELSILFNAKTSNPEQQKAKYFWFFSYHCMGMNIKDIALLKYKNLENNSIIYYRAKTINTAKQNIKPISIPFDDLIEKVIIEYGNLGKVNVGKDDLNKYIFPILNTDDSDDVIYRKVKNFTRFINQHIKNLAIIKKINENISVQWARHSFATNIIRCGGSTELVKELLNHSNMKVTQDYIDSIPKELKNPFISASRNYNQNQINI